MNENDEKEKIMKCDFCRVRDSVGCFSTHMPISLNYCQECLDVNDIRTRHNVHMNWISVGDKYLENDHTVWFKDNYMSIKEYINCLTEADVIEYYPSEQYYPRIHLIAKIKVRN